jgi:hypothetical protein
MKRVKKYLLQKRERKTVKSRVEGVKVQSTAADKFKIEFLIKVIEH